MTKEQALQIFRDSGALLEGHFILRSGLHSRQFFQCALALQQMPVVEKLGAGLAAKVKSLGAKTVVSPAMGGLVIGQEVARQLGLRVQETLDIVRAHGGNVVGVAMVVDRSNGAVNFGVPFESLISLQVETFEADKLPPDLAKIPAVKPGSK